MYILYYSSTNRSTNICDDRMLVGIFVNMYWRTSSLGLQNFPIFVINVETIQTTAGGKYWKENPNMHCEAGEGSSCMGKQHNKLKALKTHNND